MSISLSVGLLSTADNNSTIARLATFAPDKITDDSSSVNLLLSIKECNRLLNERWPKVQPVQLITT